MTEGASLLTRTHCVRLDCACNRAIITPTFRKAPLNRGKVSPPASSPSQALRASSPKGRAFSRRQTFRYIQNLSLWERWHRGAMTERASPLPAAHRVRLDCACDGAIITPTFRKAQPNQEHSFLSASLPSQALRASSPKVGALGKGVKSERNA